MTVFNSVGINSPVTAFGLLSTAQPTPQVQIKFPYGINPEIGQTLTNNASSTVTNTDGYAKVTCAAAAEAFSQIRTLERVRYSPGQGAAFAGTCARVTGGVANSSQVFGLGDEDEGFFFGYNGTSFGILRRSLGSLEIKSLAISNVATGTGNITITLDSTPVTVAITSGWTVAQTVEAIVAEADNFFNAGRGWETHTDDDNAIEFTSLVAEVAGGTFSFVDTDTTGVAGVFSQTVTGAAPTETWVAQTSWNVDVMDGTGASGMTLDTSKLNVFRIQFQYLGAGAITFCIEDDSTGAFTCVHRIDYANTVAIPTVRNPTFHLTIIAKTESGYSGSALEMRTASMAGFIEGEESPVGIRRAVSGTKSIGTTANLALMIHNEIDFNSQVNKVDVYPTFLTASTEAGKPVELIVRRNPTRVDGGVTLTNVDAGVSVMQYSTTGTTVNNGEEIAIFEIEAGSPLEVDLTPFEHKLRPGDRWVITGRIASGASANVTVGVSWIERI
jgi:hypothetical protein